MYDTGIIHAVELNRFFTLHTIKELELGTSECFFVDSIDEDDPWESSARPEPEARVFIPPHFSSVLFPPFGSVLKTSRPVTHKLVSPLDEVVPLTGSRNIRSCGVAWPPLVPGARDCSAYNVMSQSAVNIPSEDEEDNWVDFAAVQRQLKLETTLNPYVQDDGLEFLKGDKLENLLTDGKDISMISKPAGIAWPESGYGGPMLTGQGLGEAPVA